MTHVEAGMTDDGKVHGWLQRLIASLAFTAIGGLLVLVGVLAGYKIAKWKPTSNGFHVVPGVVSYSDVGDPVIMTEHPLCLELKSEADARVLSAFSAQKSVELAADLATATATLTFGTKDTNAVAGGCAVNTVSLTKDTVDWKCEGKPTHLVAATNGEAKKLRDALLATDGSDVTLATREGFVDLTVTIRVTSKENLSADGQCH
jgi:hypothetical protein